MKKCNSCKQILSLDNFHKKASNKDGYMNVCKTCRKNNNIKAQRNSTITEKQCSCCNNILPISEFSKSSWSKIGIESICKNCKNLKYSNNKDNISLRRKELYIENRDKILEQKSKYTKSHKSEKAIYDKIYRQENKLKIAKQKKEWSIKNKNNLEYKIAKNLRRRIHHVLKDNYKSDNTISLLGCSINEFKSYLELLFEDGMTWDNYGLYGWHIDHIIPCYIFDLSDSEQQKECFHFSNMRPLWAKDNLTRSKSISTQDIAQSAIL